MNDHNARERRARGSSHLRNLVSETRGWMAEKGIQERRFDWKAFAREEAARWWRERLKTSLTYLSQQGGEFAHRLRQLSASAESQAVAALDITFDTAETSLPRLSIRSPVSRRAERQQVGSIGYDESAKACLSPDAAKNMVFRHASPRTLIVSPFAGTPMTVRERGIGYDGVRMSDDAHPESAGVFASSTIQGGWIMTDEAQSITVRFSDIERLPLVVLVPEDTAHEPRLKQAVRVNEFVEASFDGLDDRHYVVCIYSLDED